MMIDDSGEARPPLQDSLRPWWRFILPEARMRVATHRRPRDWFELLTRIPILERLVIKRFVENLMCDQWLQEPHRDLDGLAPTAAAQQPQGRALLQPLLAHMARNREKTPRQLRRIRRHLSL